MIKSSTSSKNWIRDSMDRGYSRWIVREITSSSVYPILRSNIEHLSLMLHNPACSCMQNHSGERFSTTNS